MHLGLWRQIRDDKSQYRNPVQFCMLLQVCGVRREILFSQELYSIQR